MKGEELKGHLDLLLLSALAEGPAHGYLLIERLRERSGGAFDLPEGTVYPALHRLERRGWIGASWGASDNNRRAKFYELTRAGRKQLEAEAQDWQRLTAAVALVLRMS